jgi:hypothetical protein
MLSERWTLDHIFESLDRLNVQSIGLISNPSFLCRSQQQWNDQIQVVIEYLGVKERQET